MFNKIILGFLAFLLWIFPNSKALNFSYDKTFYDKQTIADTVMTAVKSQDAEALTAMICKNIKDNTSDLSDQIATLFGYTNGATNYTVDGGGAEYSGNRGSNHIIKRDVDIKYQISEVKYSLFIVWEINNFSPAERGIRHVNLMNADTKELLIDFKSTEGFLYWHD